MPIDPVVDLWENHRGVSNVFLTYFDYFFGVNTNLEGLEAPEGVKSPNPPTNRALHRSHSSSMFAFTWECPYSF